MKMFYHNLTQTTGERLVYIRSTDIEQKNWTRLLWSIPDEWLYFLSLGHEITIIDKTSNKNGGKVNRIFCPVISDVLNYLLLGQPPINKNLKFHYNCSLSILDSNKSLKKKFTFWRGKITKTVNINGKPIIVNKEPNPI